MLFLKIPTLKLLKIWEFFLAVEIKRSLIILKLFPILLITLQIIIIFFFTLPKYKSLISNHFIGNSKIHIYLNHDDYYLNISKLDFAIACSGTVHLELSLSYIPHLIFYNTNFLNILFFKFFIKAKFISLLNIFAEKEVVKEFLQNSFNSNSIKIYIDSINNKKDLDKITNDLKISIRKFNINHFNLTPVIDYLKRFS